MKKTYTTLLSSLILVALPLVALGQNIEFKNPIKAPSIQALVTLILDIVINIGAIIAVFMFVVVGFMFVKARGNPSELTTAKRALTYTAIGTVVLLGAKIIQQILENTIKQF